MLEAGCDDKADKVVNQKSEGFGLFLTARDVAPDQLLALAHIEAAEQPLIAAADIVSYARESHSMVLTDQALNRLEDLEITTAGKSFLVCVDGQLEYTGAFWVPFSSKSFDGAVILLLKPLSDTLRIQLGYPESIDGTYPDPRADPDVMAALESAGKLK